MLAAGEGSDWERLPAAHRNAPLAPLGAKAALLARERFVHTTLGVLFYASGWLTVCAAAAVAWVCLPPARVFLAIIGHATQLAQLGQGPMLTLIVLTMVASCSAAFLVAYCARALMQEGRDRLRTAAQCTMAIVASCREPMKVPQLREGDDGV